MSESSYSSLISKPPTLGQLNAKVLLMKNDIFSKDQEGSTPDIVKLRHPRSGLGTMFVFAADNSIVQEIVNFSDKRSWFINNSIRENGSLYFCTPVDTCFLILPYLKKSKEEVKIVPLEDLLFDEKFPETHRLLKSVFNSIHLLADKKGPDDLNVWVYNEEKVLKWLSEKTVKVAKVLEKKQISIGGHATSSNYFQISVANLIKNNEKFLIYAHELISEYLTDDLSYKLARSLSLPELDSKQTGCHKRKLSQTTEQEIKDKKIRLNAEKLIEVKNEKLKSSHTKKLVKPESGSKSITSFFKKK